MPGPLAHLTGEPGSFAPGSLVGLACAPGGLAMVGADGRRQVVPIADAPGLLARLDRDPGPRWVWWSARATAAPLLVTRPGLRLARCWDLAAAHRLLHGGSADTPDQVWAMLRGLDPRATPRAGQLDLLGTDASSWGLDARTADDDGDPEEPVRPDGHLRPDWVGGAWAATPARSLRWAALALEAATTQREAVSRIPSQGDALYCTHAESAAELLAVELAATGLPLGRSVAEAAVGELAGRRPVDEADERALREVRDRVVLDTVPTEGRVDLRSPAQVKDLLSRNGFDLPDTRSWRLEPMVGTHPLVAALLSWRRAERVATTYGYRWLDEHVGADGRLRGAWSGSDGGAGRMTAQAGLHSMPHELRVAVVAEPGHAFVRADLGQIEPRVLAAISRDRELARAAAADDMYADVAAALRCERPVAKVAVLAAMYGQTSGTAADALRDMERAYPTAMRFLQAAHDQGRAGRDVLTYGGRRVRMWSVRPLPSGADAAAVRSHRAALAARGRFARNAVVQGSAAELFKAWTATVRARLARSGSGEVVLCLHDELLLHVREDVAEQVAHDVVADLEATAARWSDSGVRLVADVGVMKRWSDANG